MVLKDKLWGILKILSLFEQNSIWPRQYPIKQIKTTSKELYKMKDLQAEGDRNKEVILGKSVGWLLQSHFPLGTWVFQAVYLTSFDQVNRD